MPIVKTPTNEQIINYVLSNGIPWDKIDPATRATYEARKDLLFDDSTMGTRVRNEFMSDIINKVGLTRFTEARMTNPLAFFRAENMPYGDFTEDIIVAPAEGQEYQSENEEKNPFNSKDPTVKATYVQTNRQQKYSVGYKETDIAKAFTTPQGTQLNTMINQFVRSCDEGNTRDEYIFSKQLLKTALTSTKKPLLPTQTVTIPYDLRNPELTLQETATGLAYCQQAMTDLHYNSSAYNAQGIERSVPRGALTLILHKNVEIVAGVKALAYAFNPEYQRLNVPLLALDEFPDNDDILFFITEPQTFRTHLKEFGTGSIFNPATGRLNVWLRLQQVFVYNPAGCLRVVRYKAKETPKP